MVGERQILDPLGRVELHWDYVEVNLGKIWEGFENNSSAFASYLRERTVAPDLPSLHRQLAESLILPTHEIYNDHKLLAVTTNMRVCAEYSPVMETVMPKPTEDPQLFPDRFMQSLLMMRQTASSLGFGHLYHQYAFEALRHHLGSQTITTGVTSNP